MDPSSHWAEPAWREQFYSLTLLPETEAGEALRRMTSALQPDDGPRQMTYPMPDIPLATFTGREAMEETLTRWMQRICANLKRFSLALGEPTLLPDGSLRMKVKDPASLKMLTDRLEVLETYIRSCGTGPVEWIGSHFCRIGKSIPAMGRIATQTTQGLKPMEGVFPVHCLLLEKRIHAEDRSEKVYLCPFMPG
jgi:hypothetical protein